MVKIGIHVIALNMRKLAGNRKIDRMFMFVKKIWPQGFVCPYPRAKYIIYGHVFQASSPLKQLG